MMNNDSSDKNVSSKGRRDFLKISGLGVSGLSLGFYMPGYATAATKTSSFSANAYLSIASDETVTVMCSRAEMGQGVYTSLAALIADELDYDLDKINIKFAPVAEAFTNDYYGVQLTGASTSVRDAWLKLRRVGATAKTMLTQAAAQQWGVPTEECSAKKGFIRGPEGLVTSYGSLVEDASRLDIPKEVVLKKKSHWDYIGNPDLRRLDTKDKVQAKTQYGIDTKLPGMLYASIKMSGVFNAKVKSFDASRTLSLPGVKRVVKIDPVHQLTGLMPGGVAVVADSYWTAKKGRDLLKVEWEENPNQKFDMDTLWKGLEEGINKPGVVFREQGDAIAGISNAADTISAVYRVPFVSHSPMEPVNTTAHVMRDKVLIITPHQLQGILPGLVSQAIGLAPEQIEIQTTFLGGGFGRKLGGDFVVQAALISQAVGAPVNLIWDREDDMSHDSFRPAAMIKITGGIDEDGNLASLEFKGSSPHISAYQFPIIVHEGVDPHAVEGIDNFPYKTPDLKFTTQDLNVPVSIGYLRSVSNAQNCTAMESFMDECAYMSGRDPIQYRVDMLNMADAKYEHSGVQRTLSNSKYDSAFSVGLGVGARMQKTLELIRKRSEWDKPLPVGQGRGVAILEAYNTVCATVVEVEVTSTYDLIVNKVYLVIDAGQLVHPDQALAQMEGQINFGLEIAKKLEITVDRGAVQQDNFDSYPVGRMNESPAMDIHFIETDRDYIGGLGEPVVPVIQPAVGNAIFAACGKRCRTLPYTPENIARS